MKLSLARLLVLVPLLVIGCSADGAGEATDTTAGAASTSANEDISLANFKTHPKVTAIRNDVMEIERLELVRTEKSGCDLSNTQYESEGQVRKVISEGGKAPHAVSTSIYYDAQGNPIFVFHKEGGLESRTYFTASGDTLFQAMRETSDDEAPKERLPEGDEVVESSKDYRDAQKWFTATA